MLSTRPATNGPVQFTESFKPNQSPQEPAPTGSVLEAAASTASHQLTRFVGLKHPLANPPGARSDIKSVEVEMGRSVSLNRGHDPLATRGLSDCSALAVLTGWNGSTYQNRTLMHLTGSNLELGLNPGNSDTRALMHRLQASLDKNSHVILVAGVNSSSLQGMATTIGQTLHGEQPLRDLLIGHSGAAVTLASSTGITINADGTFKLLDGTGKGVLSREDVASVFDRVD
ncbi:hypothetical protein C4J91_3120 [Pseudomonas sp. R3-52-08]|nr:hypothetical protein C4J91_3120 [Pseudomonas sp. R3-52-08]